MSDPLSKQNKYHSWISVQKYSKSSISEQSVRPHDPKKISAQNYNRTMAASVDF
jgi:hypothetical protein